MSEKKIPPELEDKIIRLVPKLKRPYQRDPWTVALRDIPEGLGEELYKLGGARSDSWLKFGVRLKDNRTYRIEIPPGGLQPRLIIDEPEAFMPKTLNPGRPPKLWWNRMFFSMSRQYPRKKSETLEHYRAAISRITGGVWANYSEETKSKLLKLYENPVMKNPLACPCCGTLNTISRELHLRCSGCGKPLVSVKIRRK